MLKMVIMKYFGSTESGIEFAIRVICDREPSARKLDAVYLYTQTSDNQASVLNIGAVLYNRESVKAVAICDGETKHGYPGFKNWYQEFINRGWPKKI